MMMKNKKRAGSVKDKGVINVIIDTDPGHDDALAIMLAVKSGLFRIHAITTVAGNSTIENTTRNARHILNLLQREDIPVYSGAEKPLKQDLIQAVVHGSTGLAGIDPKNEPRLTYDAVQRIIELVKKNPYRITLIALAPLTNIATAMQQNPDIMKQVKEIVLMGGTIAVPGNKSRVAEFNIFVDPEAADIVFRFPVKKTMVPLDACNDVQLHLSDFERIQNARLRLPILNMMKPYIENTFREEGVRAALMYDPLTVYALINPRACSTTAYDVVIETAGSFTRGMTVAERRQNKASKKNVTVVEKVSEVDFKKDFIEILSRL
jgi:purine nucleosidase